VHELEGADVSRRSPYPASIQVDGGPPRGMHILFSDV